MTRQNLLALVLVTCFVALLGCKAREGVVFEVGSGQNGPHKGIVLEGETGAFSFDLLSPNDGRVLASLHLDVDDSGNVSRWFLLTSHLDESSPTGISTLALVSDASNGVETDLGYIVQRGEGIADTVNGTIELDLRDKTDQGAQKRRDQNIQDAL